MDNLVLLQKKWKNREKYNKMNMIKEYLFMKKLQDVIGKKCWERKKFMMFLKSKMKKNNAY